MWACPVAFERLRLADFEASLEPADDGLPPGVPAPVDGGTLEPRWVGVAPVGLELAPPEPSSVEPVLVEPVPLEPVSLDSPPLDPAWAPTTCPPPARWSTSAVFAGIVAVVALTSPEPL